MAEQHQAAGGAGTFEYLLREQAQSLTLLRVQRGNPSLRMIQARAEKLFADEKASLPIATQSTVFRGGHVGQDRLLWLVRALLSWDAYGRECPPPAYGAPELDEWYERCRAITVARPRRRRAPVASPSTVPEVQEPTAESEIPPVPPMHEPASDEPSVPSLRLPEVGSYVVARSFKHGLTITRVAFSPDSALLATGGNGTVRVWDPAARQPVGDPLDHHGDQVYAVAFSPDGPCSPPAATAARCNCMSGRRDRGRRRQSSPEAEQACE